MKNITKASARRIGNEIIKIIDEMEMLENVSVFFNGEEHRFDSRGHEQVIQRLATDCSQYANDDTVSIAYDGGMFWDVMNGTFGYSLRDRFESELQPMLDEYGAYIEDCHSWFATIAV